MPQSNYKIRFKKSAEKEYLKLSKNIRERINEALLLLSYNPYSSLLNIKKLKHKEKLYRVRIGNYRILYTVNNNVLEIIVIKIGHRKEVYR